ncbi:hypothetical protein DsansV1_C03g0029321 [Dioscorea sansibarensis]
MVVLGDEDMACGGFLLAATIEGGFIGLENLLILPAVNTYIQDSQWIQES